MALFVLFAGCTPREGILAPAGLVAERQFDHLLQILWWMGPVVLPLFLALPIVVWRNRIGGRGSYDPRWELSWPLEILVWGIPFVVVSVLSWTLWQETTALDPYDPVGPGEPLFVQAVALDWKWLFLYRDLDVAAADRLVLPADRPIRLQITSGTVLQALSIPSLGGQIYAMPGMATALNLRTGAPGRHRGLNMQYNGEKFATQSFETEVVTQTDFDAWVEATAQEPPLGQEALQTLWRRETLDAPRLYGAIAGDPFAAVLAHADTAEAGR